MARAIALRQCDAASLIEALSKVIRMTAHDAMAQPAATSSLAQWREARLFEDLAPLVRGLDALALVAEGVNRLPDLSSALGLSSSSTGRLVDILLEHRMLSLDPGRGFSLGPKVMQLGYQAANQADLADIAQDHLRSLAANTRGIATLSVFDGERAICLAEVCGGTEGGADCRIGQRHLLSVPAIGQALLLDERPAILKAVIRREAFLSAAGADAIGARLQALQEGVATGVVQGADVDGRGPCMAAPIRDGCQRIIGAVGLSYVSKACHADAVGAMVLETALAISAEMGWTSRAEPARA